MALDSKRVTEEYLTAYPKGFAQQWYHRTYDEISSSYIWSRPSAAFKHDKSLQEKTRENSSYISIGAQFNHAQLTQIFNWFRNNLRFLQLRAEGFLSHNFTTSLMSESDDKAQILKLLQSADIGVSEANVVSSEVTVDDLKARLPPDMLADMEAKGQLKPRTQLEIKLLHTAKGIPPLPFNFEDEESAGTRRFFCLVGPWLDILKHGTDPLTLTERAIELRDLRRKQARRNLAIEYDEVWVVFDLEKPHDERRQLAVRAQTLKGVKGIKFATSDPAFEYWLLLHEHYTTAPFSDCDALISRLKQFWTDYDKGRSPSPEFLEKIPTAVMHAGRCRKFHQEIGGAKNPSTDVDHLVRSLNLATRPHLQFDFPKK
jgi:hypothetical protein